MWPTARNLCGEIVADGHVKIVGTPGDKLRDPPPPISAGRKEVCADDRRMRR